MLSALSHVSRVSDNLAFGLRPARSAEAYDMIQVYLTQSAFQVILQKPNPTQMCRLILYISSSKQVGRYSNPEIRDLKSGTLTSRAILH